jgi:hypothetical protein
VKILAAIFFLMAGTCAYAQETDISPGLTAVYDPHKNIVKLKWQQNDPDIIKFVLQRSSNNSTWTDIAMLNVTNDNKGKFVKHADEKVAAGKNYYRLKIYFASNVYQYTASIMVIIGQPGNSWIMYPVPVTTTLNLQYNGSELIPGVISVIIQSISNGQILCRLRVASTTRLIQIPVNNLGKGVYDVRILIADKVVWNQRFIK